LIVGFLIVRAIFRPSAEDVQRPDEKVVLVDVRLQAQRNETEARTMIERAREVGRVGKSALALSLLNRLATAYPETKAASEAREALDRSRKNLPLFSDGHEATQAASTPTIKAEPVPSATQAVGTAEITQAAGPPEPPGPTPALETTNPDAALAANIQTTVPPQTARTPGPAAVTSGRSLPAGYQARSGVGVHPSGWPLEILGGRDGTMMVLVPGGTFIMGRDGGDPAEAPAHQVKLSTYYIDKHEVTNRQFDQFVKEAGPRAERSRALAQDGGGVSLSEDHPAVMVSAKDAMDYADWAGKRLPTEAQWEMAARGIDHRPYPWGPLPPVWEKNREPHQIDAVMSFPSDRSPSGAYDMAGNALEWTKDWFDPKYFASFRGAIAEDPTGPSSRPPSSQVTVKGGSKQWIVSAREGINYESRLSILGFRCVLPLDGADGVIQPPAPPPTVPPRNRSRAGKKAVVPF